MAQYDLNLVPNGAQTLDVAGSYFTYKSGLGAIRVTSSDGAVVDLLPGQGMSKLKFDRLTVKDISGVANVGVLLAGNGEWHDERITGTVDVVDGGKSRTLANMAFVAASGPAADATTTPAMYLQNPAGSGKNIIVKSFSISVIEAQAYGLCWVTGVTGADNTASSIVSKSEQGVFAAKLFRHDTGNRLAGAQSSMATDNLPANGRSLTVFQEPIVIGPGRQIMAFGTKPASSMIVVMECIEEKI
jgi:hypothetical protein